MLKPTHLGLLMRMVKQMLIPRPRVKQMLKDLNLQTPTLREKLTQKETEMLMH
jgi:hypothetical protein